MKIQSYIIIITLILSFSSCGNINIFPISSDITIGELYNENLSEQNEQIVSEKKNPELYTILNHIKNEILKSPAIKYRNEFQWKLKIIKNDSIINAFCTPGGYIYIYTGLIKFLETEDQLAGVIGHEIAHADLRHSTQQMTKQVGLSAILFFFGLNDNVFTEMASGLANLSFSRDHETEADKYSVLYLSSTNYDPKGVSYFFEKLEKENKNQNQFQFLSTHPNPENRNQFIEKYWKELNIKELKERSINNYSKLLKNTENIK